MKGGEAVTHYIPALCERNGRQERAVCGAWIRAHEFSLEPTCATCRAYLAADAELGDDPCGSPDPQAALSVRTEPDPVAEYQQRMRQKGWMQ